MTHDLVIDYAQVVDGATVNLSDLQTPSIEDVTVAFQAIFDSARCNMGPMGESLADRPINDDLEDLLYLERRHPILGPRELSHVALYVSDARDNTAQISIVDSDPSVEEPQRTFCGPISINSLDKSGGIVKIALGDDNGPCLVPANKTGLVQFSTLSRSLQDSRNLLSHSIDESLDVNADPVCSLVVNSRLETTCNRIYSIQVLANVKSCFSSVRIDLAEEPNDMNGMLPIDIEPACEYDFTRIVPNAELEETCINPIKGPIMYADMTNPLQAGILKSVTYHYNSMNSDDTFFAVVWRSDTSPNATENHFKIHCIALASPPAENLNVGHAFMEDGCNVSDGDYLGFIYTGTSDIPLSFTFDEDRPDSDKYLSLISHNNDLEDDEGIRLSVLPVVTEKLGSYTFADASHDYKFNIIATECIVQFIKTQDENTDCDVDDCNVYTGNALYRRSMTQTDSLMVLDLLNAVPVDGFVTGFRIDGTYSSQEVMNLSMVRPIYDDSSPRRIVSVQTVCSLDILPNGTELYQFEGNGCAVQAGDRIAYLSMGSQSSLSFDEIQDYPCLFLNYSLNVIDDLTCNRMYSMGFEFIKVDELETIGNLMIDRPYQIFEPLPSSTSSEFRYVDKTSQLQVGLIYDYEIFIEDEFTSLTLGVVNDYDTENESETCILNVTRAQVNLGPNTLQPNTPYTPQNCIIDANSHLFVRISNGPSALGFSCDANFESSLDEETATLVRSQNTLNCEETMRISLAVHIANIESINVITKELDDIAGYQDYIFQEFTDNTEFSDQREKIVCEGQRITVPDSGLRMSNFSNVPMMYLDMKSSPLSDGYLENWQILVGNNESKLLAVVWRHVPDTSSYEIVCGGLAETTSGSEFEKQTIYPDTLCRVKDGDRIGFVASIDPNGDDRIRIGYIHDDDGECLSSTYPKFQNTQILKKGTYTLTHDNCVQSQVFAINVSLCLSLDPTECKFGRELPDDIPDLVSDPSLDLNDANQTIYVDHRDSLPLGSFISWNILVSNPFSPIYPVVWREIEDSKFEIACIGYDDSRDVDPDEIVKVSPANHCEITDSNYYIGLIKPYMVEELYNRVDYQKVSNASTLTAVSSLSIEMEVFKGFEYDFLDTLSVSSNETDRIYHISANICLKDQSICQSHLDESGTSQIALDRYILIQEFEESGCLSRLTIDSSKIDTDFYITIFEPTMDLTTNEHPMKYKSSRLLTTTKIGQESFDISGFCAKKGHLVGFYFLNRRLPFMTSQNTATVNYITYSSNSINNYSTDANVTFFRNSSLGFAPAEYCFEKYQIIGSYYLYDEMSSIFSTFIASQPDPTLSMVSVLEKEKVSIHGNLIEIGADIIQPGPLKLLALSLEYTSNGSKVYRIEKIWQIDFPSSGYAYVELDPSFADIEIDKDNFLAIAQIGATISYRLVINEGYVPMSAIVAIEELSVGNIIETSPTSLEPKFGVRIGFDN